jgi:hypothetical protein
VHIEVRIRRSPEETRECPSSKRTGGARSITPERNHFEDFCGQGESEIVEERTIVRFGGETIREENLFDVLTSEDTRICVV